MENVWFEDVSAEVLEDENMMECMWHFDAMKQELNMDSVWSIYDAGPVGKDFAMLKDQPYLVRYQYVRPDATSEEISYDLENGTQSSMAEVTMTAWNGTIEALWFAANSCIKQSGTHHSYIEDFDVNVDGSLTLTTGS